MHRFFVEPGIWNDTEILLPSDTGHHLVHVLRAVTGEMVEVFDGNGHRAAARVFIEKGHQAVLKIVESSVVKRPGLSVSLIQAMPRGARMELIIEKSTELGVSAVYPVITERVVTKLSSVEKRNERRERWQRIAVSAAEQAGVNWVPAVKQIDSYDSRLPVGRDSDLFVVGSLASDAMPLKDVLCKASSEKPASVTLLIGPEGDLSPLELRQAVDSGAVPVSFGSNVFRVETAAIFGISVIMYELGNA